LTMVGKNFDSIQPEQIKWRFATAEEAELAYDLDT